MKSPTEELQHLGQMLTATEVEDTERLDSIIERLQELKQKQLGYNRPDPSQGSTEMILNWLRKSIIYFHPEQKEAIRQALDDITIDDFLKALIADTDLEEIVAVLDVCNAEPQGKQVKLFDEDGKQIYPAL